MMRRARCHYAERRYAAMRAGDMRRAPWRDVV